MAKLNKKPAKEARHKRYEQENRQQRNKEKKQKKHQKRIEKFKKRRESGKGYVYNKELTQKKRQQGIPIQTTSKKTDYAKWESVMRKVQNQVDKEMKLQKRAMMNTINEEDDS